MSVINNKARMPISIADVKNVIAGASDSLGPLCVASTINRWALYKPIRNSEPIKLTLTQIKQGKCGLNPRAVTYILNQILGNTTAPSTYYTLAQCLGQIGAWEYLKPQGGSANVYRIADFTHPDDTYEGTHYDGYNHLAESTDSDWIDYEFTEALFDNLLTVTATYSSGNTDFEIITSGTYYNSGLLSGYSLKLGEASGESIGSPSANCEIPITFVTGDALISGEHWRLAFAVWLPGLSPDNHDYFGLFCSRKILSSSDATSASGRQKLIIDLCSNKYALMRMSEYVENNSGYYEFTAIPLLVKNMGHTQITYNGANYDCIIANSSLGSAAYCMPSGASSVKIKVGTPPVVVKYKTEQKVVSNVIQLWIENTDDTPASHSYSVNITYSTGGTTYTRTAITNTLEYGDSQLIQSVPNTTGNYITVNSVAYND